ncbi:MAG TPA: hypothetical protein VGE62_00475 [Candidatus Paceibacterota bacterium]
MKKTFVFFLTGLVLAVPAVSSAAAFNYVDMRGTVRAVEAPTPVDALAMAHAQGNILTSGVKIDQGMVNPGQFVGSFFGYVDVNGNYKTVAAACQFAALLLATDKHPQSGVIAIDPVR